MKNSTKRVVLNGLMLTLLIVSAYIKIPIPYVPFTLQFLVVTLCGQLLGAKNGGIIVGVYILMGLLGFPVFTSGGGIAYIFQPTFGYLIGFIFAAMASGYICRKCRMRHVRLWANLIGIFCMYFFGVMYLYLLYYFYFQQKLGIIYILEIGILVQLPGDIILSIISAQIASRLSRFIS